MDTLALRILKAPDGSGLQGTVYDLPHTPVIIGRSPACDITLPERTVSSRHAKLDPGPPLRVEVLTDSSGTFLDRVTLTRGQIVELQPGSRLQVGGVLLVIEHSVTQSMREPIGSSVISRPERLFSSPVHRSKGSSRGGSAVEGREEAAFHR